MAEDEYKNFIEFDSSMGRLFSEIYRYIDPEDIISKEHYLDKYLPGGFHRDNVRLETFKSYSFRSYEPEILAYYSMSRFSAWMSVRVAPYIAHGNVTNRRAIRNNVLLILNNIEKFFALHKQPESSGDIKMRLVEIKGAMIYLYIEALEDFGQKMSKDKTDYYNYCYALEKYQSDFENWIYRLDELREEIINKYPSELEYIFTLFDEIKTTRRENIRKNFKKMVKNGTGTS